jgi:FkbM family methyltransferase
VLNLEIGAVKVVDGRTCILTRPGAGGHAVYGPYVHLQPGYYVVEFNLAAAEQTSSTDDDLCATVDIAADVGRLIFEDYCRVIQLNDANADYARLLEATRFPDLKVMPKPAFFVDHLADFRRLYENGASVRIVANDVVVTIDGVSFFARGVDDLRFIDEIFFRSTYNFSLARVCCVIDIGMNIGLVAMTFARKPEVKEVHSFEPFRGTYQRACANLSLNPELAGKITANNFGLADRDEETTVNIHDTSDSGAFSIRGAEVGTPEPISVRDAATVLRPIIENARSAGRDIIAKVDCEGSEFPIFETLEASGLIHQISAFMVEWHRGINGKTQADLLAPLLRHGFLIFDLTGKTGNGFFYAVKSGEGPVIATDLNL